MHDDEDVMQYGVSYVEKNVEEDEAALTFFEGPRLPSCACCILQTMLSQSRASRPDLLAQLTEVQGNV